MYEWRKMKNDLPKKGIFFIVDEESARIIDNTSIYHYECIRIVFSMKKPPNAIDWLEFQCYCGRSQPMSSFEQIQDIYWRYLSEGELDKLKSERMK